MKWQLLHPKMTAEALGYIPEFLSEDDPRPAREQIDAHYISGWTPFEGFVLLKDQVLKYPGDPALKPVARTSLRDEQILLYPGEWLLIVQPDGQWEVARID